MVSEWQVRMFKSRICRIEKTNRDSIYHYLSNPRDSNRRGLWGVVKTSAWDEMKRKVDPSLAFPSHSTMENA